MHMDIPAFVVPVHVGTHQHLMASKKAIGKFHADGMHSFSVQTAFRHIARIEADDVMVAFHISAFLVFMKLVVELLALHVKSKRFTVNAVQVKLLSRDAAAISVTQLFAGFLIMLKHEIIQNCAVVGTFTRKMFQYSHRSHLPAS